MIEEEIDPARSPDLIGRAAGGLFQAMAIFSLN